ncbi:hypothetical protein ILYODFUR_021201 [Ilyodon furcidens]|uniref:Uncharacterized protein n=1 Tax=Ilyodon furcidens TaxID=33524 RepID=A0ABV0TKN5_9TELE
MNLHLQGDVMIRPPSPYYPLLFPPFIFFNYYIRRQSVFTDIHILPSPVRTGKQTTPGKLGVAMGNQLSYSPRVSCSSPGRKMTRVRVISKLYPEKTWTGVLPQTVVGKTL